jgi:hypothetical protein
MRTGLSTHRTIQLSILLENLESKTRMGHRGVKLMTSIKNVAGAFIFQVRLSRYLDVEAKVRQRVQREQERVERLRSKRLSWIAAADNEELGSKIDEFLGEDFGLQTSRERAALYRHAAHALSIEIETGIAVCSCHFEPITPPGGCADA